MASQKTPKQGIEAPQHPRYVRADRAVHDKAQVETRKKTDLKDAPVVISDWASI